MNKDNLETCSVCSKELSKRAEACPHCGDPKFRGDPVLGCLGGLTRGIIALVILYGLVAAGFSWLVKSCST